MSDDLHNNWGTNLFVLSKQDQKQFKPQSTENLNSEFKMIIKKTFQNQFHLQKVCADGSSANVLAIVDSTRGDTSRCLVAAGSYLCSTGYVLCNIATSVFKLNSPLSMIREPSDDDELFVKKAIIALPYHIPGAINESDLNKYEDLCLCKMHEKLLYYISQGKPVLSLFFELILAGNGATLSDRALNKIAFLSKQHNFKIVIDEIMTGGRTGQLLYLKTKPVEFVSCVSHVTLGKWCQCGIILISSEQNIIEKKQQDNSTSPQSNSTNIDLTQIIPYWNKLVTIVGMAEMRRDIVFKKIKCKDSDAWGSGSLIFTSVKNNTMNGLNHRLLPLLELTSIAGKFSKPYNNNSNNFRERINLEIMTTITNWNGVTIHDNTTVSIVNDYFLLIQYLIKTSVIHGDKLAMVSTEEVYYALNKEIKINKISSMLSAMQSAGLVGYKLNGKKRLRNWVILKSFYYV